MRAGAAGDPRRLREDGRGKGTASGRALRDVFPSLSVRDVSELPLIAASERTWRAGLRFFAPFGGCTSGRLKPWPDERRRGAGVSYMTRGLCGFLSRAAIVTKVAIANVDARRRRWLELSPGVQFLRSDPNQISG